MFAEEPVEVVVPAVPPEPACDVPLADVVVEAVPVPVGVGVGVVGLCELDWLLPFPVDAWPELDVPDAVLAVPEPEPWAAVPLPLGLVWVLEPVLVAADPVDGVEPVEAPPAAAVAELPVEADADEPPEPDELAAVVEFVEVVALAEPPDVVVEVGEGVAVGDGVGVGVGVVVPSVEVGLGVGLAVCPAPPVDQLVCEPPVLVFADDPATEAVGVGVGVGAGVGVGVGCGVAVVAALVLVVEVVEVFDEPPLIDGFTLMIGCTVITGALFTTATAVARFFEL